MNDLITTLRPDLSAVEESQLNRWRVFNGQDWVHGFREKEKAIYFAKRNGGTRIAFCKKVNGQTVYVSPERVETNDGINARGRSLPAMR